VQRLRDPGDTAALVTAVEVIVTIDTVRPAEPVMQAVTAQLPPAAL
jgi:hypothetical protein